MSHALRGRLHTAFAELDVPRIEAVGNSGRTAVAKDLRRAEARLQAALKALAVLGRLRGPAVRLTQVTAGEAERVVVR